MRFPCCLLDMIAVTAVEKPWLLHFPAHAGAPDVLLEQFVSRLLECNRKGRRQQLKIAAEILTESEAKDLLHQCVAQGSEPPASQHKTVASPYFSKPAPISPLTFYGPHPQSRSRNLSPPMRSKRTDGEDDMWERSRNLVSRPGKAPSVTEQQRRKLMRPEKDDEDYEPPAVSQRSSDGFTPAPVRRKAATKAGEAAIKRSKTEADPLADVDVAEQARLLGTFTKAKQREPARQPSTEPVTVDDSDDASEDMPARVPTCAPAPAQPAEKVVVEIDGDDDTADAVAPERFRCASHSTISSCSNGSDPAVARIECGGSVMVIRASDVECLQADTAYLNDVVINSYLRLLSQVGRSPSKPKSHTRSGSTRPGYSCSRRSFSARSRTQ